MKQLRLKSLFLATVVNVSFASTPVDLREQPFSFIQPLLIQQTQASHYQQNPTGIKQVREQFDFNGTKHIHIKQTYLGYPVWHGDAVLHIASHQQTMNGMIYQNLGQDLVNTPQLVFTSGQSDAALKQAIQTYTSRNAATISDRKKELMVYIDKEQKARWAFLVSFDAQQKHDFARPTFIVDAVTLKVLQEWDAIYHAREQVKGGGYGGNLKQLHFFSGLKGEKPALDIQRDAETNTCYLANHWVVVKDSDTHKTIHYPCRKIDKRHNNTYWNAFQDATLTGGFSPSNDAFYGATFVLNMYRNLYKVTVITKDGDDIAENQTDAMRLKIFVHKEMNNAGFNPDKKTLILGNGDGLSYYPFVSLTTVAHELSHGFTHQHAGFVNIGHAAGLNESFSDMAAQMAEYLESHQNRWMIGIDESISGKPFRYMDNPRRDCVGKGRNQTCAIDHAKHYVEGMDGHYSNGVFNKAFYLLSTSKGWDIKMAFDVMIQANMRYWLPTSDFYEAACGVVDATKDYGYDLSTVRKVFREVGIETKKC